jgi:hypothetical protein
MVKFTLTIPEFASASVGKSKAVGRFRSYIRALFRKRRSISGVKAHFFHPEKCAESAGHRQICTLVQTYRKVQN